MSNTTIPTDLPEGKPVKVNPFLALITSLIAPGLGHILAGAYRKGILLMFSLATILGLVIWRINTTARRETETISKITKSFELEPMLQFLAVAVVVLYLWIALDAFLTAKRSGKQSSSGKGLWGLVLIVFFLLGWQIGQVDVVAMTTQAKDAGPFMSKVLWPWEAAITREDVLLIGKAHVNIPCSDEPVPPVEPESGEPVLQINPDCGELSKQDGTPGTDIHLSGSGFAPDTETEIWWEDSIRNEFRARYEGEYVKTITDENGEFELDIIMPYRLIPPSAAVDVLLWTAQARQTASAGPAKPSEVLKLTISKMIETIFLGMMATFFGVIFAIPVSFLAARNLMSANKLTLAIYFITRTILNIIRAIEPMIWAVIAVVVVGLGPFAGILALTVHTVAALGKLYSESIESIDPGPIEAIHATGANWIQTIVYAVVPQIIPPFVSFTIYRWDINVRMSTIIGLVGGGGIGFLLLQWIRLLDYKAAGVAVWFIAITVSILDYVSAEIRKRFV